MSRRSAVNSLVASTRSLTVTHTFCGDLSSGHGTFSVASGAVDSVKLVAKPVAEQDGYDKRLVELKDAFLKHFDQEERVLMPKLRSLMRTEDREDLGQVFIDAKAELLGGSAPTAAPGRKRA